VWKGDPTKQDIWALGCTLYIMCTKLIAINFKDSVPISCFGYSFSLEELINLMFILDDPNKGTYTPSILEIMNNYNY
jgi:serine/threonine protein kinase